MDKELKKLNDDDLENVSGGTYRQTRETRELSTLVPCTVNKM